MACFVRVTGARRRVRVHCTEGGDDDDDDNTSRDAITRNDEVPGSVRTKVPTAVARIPDNGGCLPQRVLGTSAVCDITLCVDQSAEGIRVEVVMALFRSRGSEQ